MSGKPLKICPLPWMQVSILPDGKVRLCCHSKVSNINMTDDVKHFYIQKDPLKKILNSNWLNKIRESFVEGTIPESCTYCFSQNSHHSDSPVDHYAKTFGLPEKLDTNTFPRIRYLDISITRVCNLQCLMCSPHFSTGLESLYGRGAKDQMARNPFELDFIESEDFEVLTKDLEAILLQGGEPFLSPLHIPMLENLISKNRSSNITLNYITNGTVLPRPEVLGLWKKFAKVNIEVSLDDVKDRAEYIRHPLKWNDFEKKFQEFSFLSHSEGFSLDTVATYQALNVFSIPRIFEFLKKYNLVSRVPIINILEHPRFLTYRWLPLEVRKKVLDQLDSLSMSTSLTELEAARVDFLKSKILEDRPEDSSTLKFDFVSHLKRTNVLREERSEGLNDIMDFIS